MTIRELSTEDLISELDRRENEEKDLFWRIFVQLSDKTLQTIEKLNSGQLEEPLLITREEFSFATKDALSKLYELRGLEVHWQYSYRGNDGVMTLTTEKDGSTVHLIRVETTKEEETAADAIVEGQTENL